MRIIKKYPNRRLYDTEDSKYITLASVAEYAKAGEQFKVIDTESKEDITRGILLQIILEQEGSDQAMFSVDSLSEIVGYYGNTMPSLFNEYFQQSLKAFSEGQTQLQDQFKTDSMKVFEDMAKDNMEMWTSVQDNFLKMAGFSPIPSDKENTKKDE
ncbi:MAG: polyhydroxyalkanoate synthesis repressor PhaR [Gammaproteobacteria bacterium]